MLVGLTTASLIRAQMPQPLAPPTHVLSTRAARTLALGRTSAMATLTWSRAVDAYANGNGDPRDVVASVRTVGALDPTWVEPWFFGILMLSDEDRSLRDQLIDEAATMHPDVPWFAWRAGMARLGRDREAALNWLRQAASAPGADPAYRDVLIALEAKR